jgi:hypothetical protein
MHPRVSPTIEKGQRVVPLRLIEGNALLEVLSGRGKLSQPERAVP